MMWLNRKLLLVVVLLAGSIFAHSPSTAHFCVSSFDLHYEGFFFAGNQGCSKGRSRYGMELAGFTDVRTHGLDE